MEQRMLDERRKEVWDWYMNKRLPKLEEHYAEMKKKSRNAVPPLELRDLRSEDIMILRSEMNPSNQKRALDNTKNLLHFYAERKVLTLPEIYEELHMSDKTVTKRQKALLTHGLVYRYETFYIATPRLFKLVENPVLLTELCGTKEEIEELQKRK